MNKLTAGDLQRHLAEVVAPSTLGQISPENQQIACGGMAKAINEREQKTGRNI